VPFDVDAVLATLPQAPASHAAGPGAPTDALARAAAHASRLPPSVEGHGGDAALWHAAQELATLGLNEQDVIQVLEAYFSPRCTPPWDRQSIQWKAKRAVEEQAKLWAMYPPARARALAVADAIPTSSADATYTAVEGQEPSGDGVAWGTIEANPAPRDYRVQEFEWGAGRPLGLLASYNASKTLTSKQILVDYVLGRDILGKYKIGSMGSGRVLDLCYEQFTKAAWTYTRLARAAGAAFDELNQLIRFGRPTWYLSDGMTRPQNQELREYREECLKRLCEGFDICNVDPYSAASLGIDEGGSEFQGPARMLERVSEATGCAFMICVHRGRDQEAEHARGHSSIDDAFDTTILISKHDEEQPNARLFKCLKRPMYGFEPEVLHIQDVNEDGSPWKRTGPRDESWGVRVATAGFAPRALVDTKEAHMDKVVTMLQKHRHAWHSARRVREHPSVRLNNDNVGAALAAAVARGLVQVQRAPKGEGYEYCYVGPAESDPALDRASRFSGIKAKR